jgi:hypothetical protein
VSQPVAWKEQEMPIGLSIQAGSRV